MKSYVRKCCKCGKKVIKYSRYATKILCKKCTKRKLNIKFKKFNGLIENIGYVICPICLEKMEIINEKHIKNHGFKNKKEFFVKFPNQILSCKNSKEKKSKIQMGKSYEKKYGIERSKIIKNKQSKSHKGKKFSKKHCENIKKVLKGKTFEQRMGVKGAKEAKRKLRIARIEQIQKIGNGTNANMKTIPIFKGFDKLNNTKGIYKNSKLDKNEYLIVGLGYRPDYINFELKIIIEIDEKRHFNKNGTLKKKDIERQKEIQEEYPDFKFLRFKDTEMKKILELRLEKIND